MEGDVLKLRPGIVSILEKLNERGILNSITSRNEMETASAALKEFQIDRFFVAPRINFNPKTENIASIAADLNIGIDSLAFIDDSPFERQSVKFTFPEILVLSADSYIDILTMPEFTPTSQTYETKHRTAFYRQEEERKQAENEFAGSRLDFLESCDIAITLRKARVDDIPRVVELSERTNQFNSTGKRYASQYIFELIKEKDQYLIVTELRDKFGEYGLIGAMLLNIQNDLALIKNLMISCRAAGRGVSAAMIILAMKLAQKKRVNTLLTEYQENERNRQLGIFYIMTGFVVPDEQQQFSENYLVYDINKQGAPEYPEWLNLQIQIDLEAQ